MKAVASIAFIVLASALLAQTEDGIAARALFYEQLGPSSPKPGPKPQRTGKGEASPIAGKSSSRDDSLTTGAQTTPITVPAYSPLAVKYSILQETRAGFQEVAPDKEFRSGDWIRLRVASNGAAYLYIVMQGSSGKWQVLFPSKETASGDDRVEKGQSYLVPTGEREGFCFDQTVGVEKLSLVLSREPEQDLEKLIYTVATRGQKKTLIAEKSSIDGSVLRLVRDEMSSRDLVFGKFEGSTPDGTPEKAMYAATRDRSPNARLFVDVALNHK